ncbi:MAG: hypothetical protein AAF799_08140 [Myxococcota bacterium]
MSSGSDEVGGRRKARQQLVSSLADGLAARHSLNELRQRASDTFAPPDKPKADAYGESNPLYDLVRLGFQTTRELLEIQVRANRQLTKLVQGWTSNKTFEHDGAFVRIGADNRGTFELSNDTNVAVTVILPEQLRLRRSGDAEPVVVLVQGAGGKLAPCAQGSFPFTLEHTLEPGTWIGELEVATDAGDCVAIPVLVTAGTPSK